MPAPSAEVMTASAGPGRAPVVEMFDVHAGYGKVAVLRGVNLTVPRGSVFALLGPNGAGKSTLLKVAGGRLVPTSGCVHVAGRHVNGTPPETFARAGVCSIPDQGVFPNLTVAENIRVFTHAGGVSASAAEERAFSRFPRLAERRRQLAGTLSGGERQMLAMARAFVNDPAVLLLDEISMGLAPMIVAQLYEVVGGLADEGITVVLVEQFAQAALRVATYAAIMKQGRIERVGEPGDIRDELAGAYLGGHQ